MQAISHESILKMGPYRGSDIASGDAELATELYRSMVRLRRCEEAIIGEYHPADEIRCPVHFCVGQEAAPAALSVLLRPEDYLFSHHRSHGYFLAKGAPMNSLFAELYGKETGANGGKAGSQDISMSSVNFFSGAILSGAVAIAGGAALSFQLKGQKNVAVAGFGEGASDEGIFWEAMNYAALRKLPVVFVCENNRYATYSDQLKRQPADNLSQRVEAFGVRSKALFGNDVIAVHSAIAEAMDLARSGQGPSFIECYTYRWNGHVGPEDDDHIGYRPEAERQFWRNHCPIKLLEEKMMQQKLLDENQRGALTAAIDAEIKEAFEFAKNSPFPGEADWEDLNRSNASPLADQLLHSVESSEFNQNQASAIPGPY